jgi:Uma2 family endonuclease
MAVQTRAPEHATAVARFMATAPQEVLERFERVNGRWKEREMAGWQHQSLGDDLIQALRRAGFRASGGVHVILGPRRWPVPDVLAIAPNNPVQPGEGPYRGVPDLVVEILSVENDQGEDLEKKSDYAAAGVPNYWLLRVKTGRAHCWALRKGDYVEVAEAPLQPVEALPATFHLGIDRNA